MPEIATSERRAAQANSDFHLAKGQADVCSSAAPAAHQYSLICHPWKDISCRAELIENLLSNLISDLPAGQSYALVKSYLAVRLELVVEHVRVLKASLATAGTSILNLQIRRFITCEWNELSAKINAWSVPGEHQLQSLIQVLHDDLVQMLRRALFDVHSRVQPDPMIQQEMSKVFKRKPDKIVAESILDRDLISKVNEKAKPSEHLKLGSCFSSSYSGENFEVKENPMMTIATKKYYKPSHRVDPKTGRYKSRKDRIVWTDSLVNNVATTNAAADAPN